MEYGIILDVETTGLDCNQDKIIEIAVLKFCLKSHKIIELYSELEDPKVALKEEIKKITHLDDDLLQGRTIDCKKVRSDLKGSHLVIAHNMEFDRSFASKT